MRNLFKPNDKKQLQIVTTIIATIEKNLLDKITNEKIIVKFKIFKMTN